MDLLPIANKLEYEGLGIAGKTLFVNFMPTECKEGLLLRSPLAGSKVNFELPGYYKTEFALIARSHQFANAKTMIEEAMPILCFAEEQVEDIYVKYVRPRTLPVAFPVSDGNYYEVQAIFEVVYVGKTYGY
jgi:hypothetical protein